MEILCELYTELLLCARNARRSTLPTQVGALDVRRLSSWGLE